MKRCGKSRLLETISYLVHKPWYTVGASAASLFREIDRSRPTLLLDETDALFKANKEMAEAVRMVLNAGAHHKGAVPRVVGQGATMTTKDFGVFCPKALAGIGNLPDTVLDRSLHIRLDRKLYGQRVERLRERKIESSAADLRGRLAKWIEKQMPALKNSDPELPDELNDRQQDGAEILLAIADATGGEWPVKARKALIELYAGEAAEDQSVQVLLLEDIRAVFDERGEDRIFSASLVQALAKIETSPWSEWRNQQPMTPTQLARELKAFRIWPRDIRIGDGKAKGYERQSFIDAWVRFLPNSPASHALRTKTARQVNSRAGEAHILPRDKELNVSTQETEESPASMRVVSDVSSENLGDGALGCFDCYIHGTHTDFWNRPQGGLVCARCHPPVSTPCNAASFEATRPRRFGFDGINITSKGDLPPTLVGKQ